MQYHPTGAAFPEQIEGQLVTEKVRGLGAQLCNVDGIQFTFPLEPRDIEASAVIRECTERGKGIPTPSGGVGVWLDSPLIDMIRGEGTVARELPAMVRQFQRFNIDITREPMLIYPTLHYQNGGIAIKAQGESSVSGLYIAGEAAGVGPGDYHHLSPPHFQVLHQEDGRQESGHLIGVHPAEDEDVGPCFLTLVDEHLRVTWRVLHPGEILA